MLVANLAVAGAKIGYGYLTGAVSILSDGFHSLTDAASNIVGLVGVRAARKPPDREHPYGHRKYETLAAVGIFMFLLLVMLEILRAAWARFQSGEVPQVSGASFLLMLISVAVNLAVVRYERRAAERLASEVLFADAMHTWSDVLTSVAVLAALGGVEAGWPLADPVAALVVAGFIGHAGYQIARDSSRILADRVVMDEEDVRAVVMSVPGVLGCHQIRTRGAADHVFLDLHVWFDPATRLDRAHALAHEVKDRLMARYPQIRDAIIHLEPPPAEAETTP